MGRNPYDDEAAAIAAAIQRFLDETATGAADGGREAASPWQRAALIEGVGKRVTVKGLEGEGGAGWLS